jgi:hypothetical protein
MTMIFAITVIMIMRLTHRMTVLMMISTNIVGVRMTMMKIQVGHASSQLGILKIMWTVRMVMILTETPAIQP